MRAHAASRGLPPKTRFVRAVGHRCQKRSCRSRGTTSPKAWDYALLARSRVSAATLPKAALDQLAAGASLAAAGTVAQAAAPSRQRPISCSSSGRRAGRLWRSFRSPEWHRNDPPARLLGLVVHRSVRSSWMDGVVVQPLGVKILAFDSARAACCTSSTWIAKDRLFGSATNAIKPGLGSSVRSRLRRLAPKARREHIDAGGVAARPVQSAR